MARRYVIAPAADRALMRRVLARVDQMLGYPRTHADDEPGVRRNGGPPIVTETACAVWVHDDTGASVLHGAIAAQVDGVADELRERTVEHLGVRQRIREWIAARGWEVRATLPGVESAWSLVAPRDGDAGSADGVPIPDGEE